MKTQTLFLCLIALLIGNINIFGQRYLEEVFDSFTVEKDVVFGENVTILPTLIGGFPEPIDLTMDVYQPMGDDFTERPIAIYLHTGSLLPSIANSTPIGSTQDYTVVEVCTRLAKMGYVAVAMNYRKGWNPTASTESGWRIRSLVQAMYRSIQDLRTCIRYFHKTVAEDENPYGIEPAKIVVLGQGTGGYIALGGATLSKLEELGVSDLIDGEGEPYIDPMELGNIDGTGYPNPTDTTYYDMTPGELLPLVLYNIPNHIGYSSNFQLAFSFGGALLSGEWIDNESVPMISAHLPEDPFAFFDKDQEVIFPPLVEPFIVDGPANYMPLANDLGVNDILNNRVFADAYTEAAERAVDKIIEDEIVEEANYAHLFPLIRPNDTISESGPWNFVDSLLWSCEHNPNFAEFICEYEYIDCTSPNVPEQFCALYPNMFTHNPDMSRAKANAYIDTLIGFFAPRSVVALNLAGQEQFEFTGLAEITPENLLIAPNPTTDIINIRLAENQIQSIQVFDLAGKLVREVKGVNTNQYQLHRDDLNNGLYIVKIKDKDDKLRTEKILLK